MKNVTLHTINLNSWIKTRNELTSLDGEFTPSAIKGEGLEFSFMMANHEDPEQIKEALLQIVQDLHDSIPGYALQISKENKLVKFMQNGDYQTHEVVSVLQGLPGQVFNIDLKEKL
ncbi:MAG: hypothetical protein WCI92_16225 [Bacteroidota bacterium]